MKKTYISPCLETVRVENQDVLTMSTDTSGIGYSDSFNNIFGNNA